MNMKKTLTLVFLVLLGYSAQCQKWQFGPEIGGNFIAVEKDTFGIDFQPAYHAGANVTYNFTDFFALRSGVFFTQKKHTYTESETTMLNLFGLEDGIDGLENVDLSIYSNSRSRVSQYYIELPLLAVYRYKMFNAYLGPYVGYMLFSRSKVEETTEVPALQVIDISALDPEGTFTAFLPPAYSYTYRTTSSQSGLNKWDVGLRGGFGIEIENIGINAYYNYGFLNYRSSVQVGDPQPYNYFQLSVNYNFSFGK